MTLIGGAACKLAKINNFRVFRSAIISHMYLVVWRRQNWHFYPFWCLQRAQFQIGMVLVVLEIWESRASRCPRFYEGELPTWIYLSGLCQRFQVKSAQIFARENLRHFALLQTRILQCLWMGGNFPSFRCKICRPDFKTSWRIHTLAFALLVLVEFQRCKSLFSIKRMQLFSIISIL